MPRPLVEAAPGDGGTVRYRMCFNENPAGPSPRAVEAVRAAAASLHLYPAPTDQRLCEALAAYHGRGLSTAHFLVADSGYEVLDLVARAFLRAGDEFIVCPPTFGVYERTARLQEARPVTVPLRPESFAHDVEGILAAVTARSRLLYLCNPNNPTGAMLTAPQMTTLLDRLPPHVTVVADEVYQHYVDRPAFPDSIGHLLAGGNLIVIQSFSKSFGLAGLRLGYGIGRPELMARLRPFARIFHVNALATAAALAALEDGAHLERSVAIVREGRRLVAAGLTALGVRVWPTETNFILFQPPGPARPLYEALLARGILVRDVERDGIPGSLRVSVGMPEANAAFLDAVRTILAGH